MQYWTVLKHAKKNSKYFFVSIIVSDDINHFGNNSANDNLALYEVKKQRMVYEIGGNRSFSNGDKIEIRKQN